MEAKPGLLTASDISRLIHTVHHSTKESRTSTHEELHNYKREFAECHGELLLVEQDLQESKAYVKKLEKDNEKLELSLELANSEIFTLKEKQKCTENIQKELDAKEQESRNTLQRLDEANDALFNVQELNCSYKKTIIELQSDLKQSKIAEVSSQRLVKKLRGKIHTLERRVGVLNSISTKLGKQKQSMSRNIDKLRNKFDLLNFGTKQNVAFSSNPNPNKNKLSIPSSSSSSDEESSLSGSFSVQDRSDKNEIQNSIHETLSSLRRDKLQKQNYFKRRENNRIERVLVQKQMEALLGTE